MARRRKKQVLENVGFNMTPMIDITFQLIIFFMLVTNMSQVDLEAVKLPIALTADEDKNPEPDRLMVNVAHRFEAKDCVKFNESQKRDIAESGSLCLDPEHWVVKIKSKQIAWEDLEDVLRVEGRLDPDPENPQISRRALQVRADGRAPFSAIQRVMACCGKSGIWKMEFGAKKPAGE